MAEAMRNPPARWRWRYTRRKASPERARRVEFGPFRDHPATAVIPLEACTAGDKTKALMSDRASPLLGVGPVADRSGRITGVGRLVFIAGGLVGMWLGFALIKPEQAEPFVLGLLAILAVVGLVALLAGAIGIVRFTVRNESDELGRALLDATGEGVLIADRDGR